MRLFVEHLEKVSPGHREQMHAIDLRRSFCYLHCYHILYTFSTDGQFSSLRSPSSVHRVHSAILTTPLRHKLTETRENSIESHVHLLSKQEGQHSKWELDLPSSIASIVFLGEYTACTSKENVTRDDVTRTRRKPARRTMSTKARAVHHAEGSTLPPGGKAAEAWHRRAREIREFICLK